jgi:hypothetical protein
MSCAGLLITPWDAGPWGGLAMPRRRLRWRADRRAAPGHGRYRCHPPKAFREALEAGIGVDPMASPAACRTYNVLLGEGRRIAAALLPVLG